MKHPKIPWSYWFKYNMYFVLENFLGEQRMMRSFGEGKKNLDARTAEVLKGRQQEYVKLDVPTLGPNPTMKEFLKMCRRPIVFKGMASKWPCCTEWSYDFFKENYGDFTVNLNDNKGLIDTGNFQGYEELPLGDYIDQVKNGSLKYLKFEQGLFVENPELKEYVDLKKLRSMWLPRSYREDIVFFMSGKDTMTPMHGAPSSNFFIQVDGSKLWSLIPAEDRPMIDAHTNRSYYYYSRIKPDKRDDPEFQLLKYSTLYQVLLEKGDVLWVPPYTWHHIVNPEPSMGVSYRFLCPGEAFRNSPLLTSLLFFATNPNPLYHMYVSIVHKKSAIFMKKESDL